MNARDDLIHYPFPLRPGLFVYLYLPKQISRDEIARLVEFLRAIAGDATIEGNGVLQDGSQPERMR